MVSGKVIVKNPTGLHLRPAGLLCKSAIEFRSAITLKTGTYHANAKSVLGVLGACIKTGDEVEFVCEGEDEKEALEFIIKLVDEGLGEDISG